MAGEFCLPVLAQEMLHSSERKTLLIFCLAVVVVLIASWAALQSSPRAASVTSVTARVRKSLDCLQRARVSLNRAAMAEQAYRLTGDARQGTAWRAAMQEVHGELVRHQALVAALHGYRGASQSSRGAPDLRGLDYTNIHRLIDAQEADDSDYLGEVARRWEHTTVHYNATVLFGSSLCIVAMLGALCAAMLRHLTLRFERQTVEAEARNRLAKTLDTLPSGFFSVDARLRMTYANAEGCRILKREPNRVNGWPLMWLFPSRMADELARWCTEVLHTGDSAKFETYDPSTELWYDVEISPSPYGVSLHLRDVTVAKRAFETKERLLAVLEATPDVVGIQDRHGMCYFNRAGRELLGIGPSEPAAGIDSMDIAADHLPAGLFPIGLQTGVYRTERTIAAYDGRQVPVSQVAIAHRDFTGEVAFISTVLRDITERKIAERALEDQIRKVESYSAKLVAANGKLQDLATRDGLTELMNHRHFQERLAEEHARSTRHGRPLSLIMLDVDDFKRFNDTFGHPAGDQVLRQVAAALRSSVRGSDLVARYGGEEFVALLPDTGEEGAMEVAERIRVAVEAMPWDRRTVTVSVGVATGALMNGPAALVEAADRALYWSKTTGRNRTTHASRLEEVERESNGKILVGSSPAA